MVRAIRAAKTKAPACRGLSSLAIESVIDCRPTTTQQRQPGVRDNRVAIGMGSNLGDRLANLRLGWESLCDVLVDVSCSRVYASAPLHVLDQPEYLNACCIGRTDLSAQSLLNRMQDIERGAGRERPGVRYGPRTLDLDLLIYGGQLQRRARLTLPHPRMAERAFVLIPLAEIANSWKVPGTESTVGQLAARTPAAGVSRTEWTLRVESDCNETT